MSCLALPVSDVGVVFLPRGAILVAAICGTLSGACSEAPAWRSCRIPRPIPRSLIASMLPASSQTDVPRLAAASPWVSAARSLPTCDPVGLVGLALVIQTFVRRCGQSAVLARVTRAVVIAEALVVAGCASMDRAYYTVTDAVEGAFTSHHHTASVRTRRPPAPPPSPWAPVSTAKTMPATLPEPVVVDGLSGNAVRALLGQPAARAGPAPGETWTYRSGSCAVELFLFPNVTHGGLQVLDSRVSGAGSGEASRQACLRRLRDAPSS